MDKRKEDVKKFIEITGTKEATAKHYLEAFGYENLEMALELYSDNNPMPAANSGNGAASSSAPLVNIMDDEPEVRPPIPSKFDILIPPEASSSRLRRPRTSVAHDVLRDFAEETREQEEMLGLRKNLFSSGDNDNNRSPKSNTIENLYKPPLDLMFRGSFLEASEEGKKKNKWLLVFMPDNSQFDSIALNKDLWSVNSIKAEVQSHFIFWQAERRSQLGIYYLQFYPVTDFPHLAFIDSKTGERLTVYDQKLLDISTREKNPASLLSYFKIFISQYGQTPEHHEMKNCGIENPDISISPSTSGAPSTSSGVFKRKIEDDDDVQVLSSKFKKSRQNLFETSHGPPLHSGASSKKQPSIIDIDEEEQLKLAIEQSILSSKPRAPSPSVLSSSSYSSSYDSDTSLNDPLDNVPSTLSVVKEEDSKKNNKITVEKTNSSIKDNDESPSWSELCAKYTGGTEFIIVFRLPDGEKETINLNSDAPIKLIKEYLKPKGYLPPAYKAFISWPRKDIFEMISSLTLKEAGLAARDTIILQRE